MAYYAELDGVSGLAQCGSALALPPDFELDYDLFILANGSEDYFSAPFNGRGIGFWSSFVAFYASTQQVYFKYPSTGRPAINDLVNIRFTSTDNGDSTFTIRCYMSVNGGAEEQLDRAIGNDVFSTPLSQRPMEWGRRPNTLYRKVGVIRTRYYESGVIQNDWDFNQSSGSVAPDLVGSNDATLSGGFSWIYYDDGTGSGDPQGIDLVTAQQLTNVDVASVALANSLLSVLSQQNEEFSKIDIFIGQLLNNTSASEKHEALNLTVSQSSSQLINSVSANQSEEAALVSIEQRFLFNLVNAQENHRANTLTINQSAGQSVSLINAEQIESASSLLFTQSQLFSQLIAEQVEQFATVDVTGIQAVTMLVVNELHNAQLLNVEQYTGQFVTLIEAEHTDNAETLLVSQVNTIDILQSQQTTDAEFVMFNQGHRVKEITAEQLTEAGILSILMSGDNRNLSGLRLVPITDKYKVIPKNNTRYTFTKV